MTSAAPHRAARKSAASSGAAPAPPTSPYAVPTRLLVLGMVDDEGVVHADPLFAAGAAAGQSDEQIRSCLRRMMHDGLVVREGRGRRARYLTTERGSRELQARLDRARRAFTQDAHAHSGGTWDGMWRVIGFEVPERYRHERDEFRTLLRSFGATTVHGGVYVTPHMVEEPTRRAAKDLGIDGYVFVATTNLFVVRRAHRPREIAAMLWPLDDLARRYRELVKQFRPVVSRTRHLVDSGTTVTDERLMPGTLSMAAAFTDVYYDDPLLPPELLPQPWPGTQARALVREARELARGLRSEPRSATLFSFFDAVMVDDSRPRRR